MYGVLNQSIAALRREPFERTEMVSQILFGETFEVLEEHRAWLRVRLSLDSYEGWIDTKTCTLFGQEQMDLLTLNGAANIATRLFTAKSINENSPIRLCPGSTIYNYNSDNGTFFLLGEEYKAFNAPFEKEGNNIIENIVSLAQYFINAPYLWGGRSPYGIDCSGFAQIVYKMVGIQIARDANQQVLQGFTVDFLNLTQPGDLAFFSNDEGAIIHVGIVLPNNKIIHSAGYVKVDLLDQHGIYSVKNQKYSHNLRVIKRIVAG
jgi:cell wall-associated NlpC family hydrolase